MARNRSFPPYLEIRRDGYYWRRRLPVSLRLATPISVEGNPDKIQTPLRKMLLCLSLRTNLSFNAKTLARRLMKISDLVYAPNAEMIMAIAPETQVQLLESLLRFEIDAYELEGSVHRREAPKSRSSIYSGQIPCKPPCARRSTSATEKSHAIHCVTWANNWV